MAEKINLKSPRVRKNKSQVATYGTQTPLSSTAVERGSTRWLSGSTVVIQGLLDVTGTARVSGLLDVTGTLNGSGTNNLDGTNNLSGDNNLTGPTEISGSLDVTGPTTIDGVLTINGDTSITGLLEVTGDTTLAGIVDITGNTTITGDLDVDGPTTITGTLDIDGVTTLNNDLNVTNSGEINVGTNMTLTPSTDGGSILFQDGSKVTSVGGTVQAKSSGSGLVTAGLNSATISTGNALINVDDLGDWSLSGTNVTLQTIGGTADLNGNLDVSGTAQFGDGVWMSGLPTTDLPANLHITSLGQIFRSTATP